MIDEYWSFSPSSLPYQVAELSYAMKCLLPQQLIVKTLPTTSSPASSLVLSSSSSVLSGIKCVGLYFSAHWCGPCRQFTPQLQDIYLQSKKTQGQNKQLFEIIFCSADHSNEEFINYYSSSMPWAAIAYDDIKREELMGRYKVSGIPRLCIIRVSDGKIIVDNAVGSTPLSIATIDAWIQLCDDI